MGKALALWLFLALAAVAARAEPAGYDLADWASVEAAADGQTVDWYAWAGETHINDYIAWVGEELAAYGITLNHVKVADTAEAVSRVLAETVAGRDEGGAVDLIWINGENFVAMKEAGLLYTSAGGPDGSGGAGWADKLPNWRLVDLERYGSAILTDFAVPVEGLQSPWGRAQLSFLYDAARTTPPRTLADLVAFAKANPGRVTYPQPPDFLGTTFLKQVLIEGLDDPAILREPAPDDAEAIVRAAMLPVLEELRPHLWRSGRAHPSNVAETRRLYADGAIALAFTMNPSDGAAGVNAGLLPPQTAVAAFETGTIGNVHFVAIPHNAGDKAAALVVANVLLSPEAQARKADPAVWGDPTVLDVDGLSEPARSRFADAPDLGVPVLSEPHASWTPVIERVWADAYL